MTSMTIVHRISAFCLLQTHIIIAIGSITIENRGIIRTSGGEQDDDEKEKNQFMWSSCGGSNNNSIDKYIQTPIHIFIKPTSNNKLVNRTTTTTICHRFIFPTINSSMSVLLPRLHSNLFTFISDKQQQQQQQILVTFDNKKIVKVSGQENMIWLDFMSNMTIVTPYEVTLEEKLVNNNIDVSRIYYIQIQSQSQLSDECSLLTSSNTTCFTLNNVDCKSKLQLLCNDDDDDDDNVVDKEDDSFVDSRSTTFIVFIVVLLIVLLWSIGVVVCKRMTKKREIPHKYEIGFSEARNDNTPVMDYQMVGQGGLIYDL